MTKPDYKSLIIFVVLAALILSGCLPDTENSGAPENRQQPLSARNGQLKPIEEIIAERKSETSKKQVEPRDLVKSALLADGSEYVVMKDGEGNKVESRFFSEGSSVRSLMVKTGTDGTVEIFARAWSGKMEQIEPGNVPAPWSISARELALIVGFKQELPRIVQTEIKTSPSVNPKPSVNSNTAPLPIEPPERK